MARHANLSRTRWRRSVAAGVLLIAISSSCNSDSDGEGSTATSTELATTTVASTTPSTTAEPASSTTAAPDITTPATPAATSPPATTTTTTEAPQSACPQAPPPVADATDSTSVIADFDGDGIDDVLSTYLVPSESRWHVRIEFGAGGSDDATITDSGMVAPARPVGGHDVDGDGTSEAFVTVGSGASAVLVGLYDVAGCDLTRVTIGADPAVFPIGATIGNVSGLSCNGVGDLDRVFASQVTQDEYEGGFEPFTLAGSTLTAGFGDGASFTGDEAAALATLDCGTLTIP